MDVSDIFIFSCRGRGRGSPRRQEGGGQFLIENPRGGGVFQERGRGGGGAEGAGRVSAGNLGGRGAKYFVSGPTCPPSHREQEDDRRATTNVQHRFVLFFLLSFLLVCSP